MSANLVDRVQAAIFAELSRQHEAGELDGSQFWDSETGDLDAIPNWDKVARAVIGAAREGRSA